MSRTRHLRHLGALFAVSQLLVACPNLQSRQPSGGGNDDRTNALPTVSPNPSEHAGNITRNETWTKANSPHLITEDVFVGSPSGVTLTIEPGVEVRFSEGKNLRFGSDGGVSGVLKALGTATESITFTSAQASKQAGDWGQIAFGNGSAASVLDHVTIDHGGGSASHVQDSMVIVDGDGLGPTIRNSVIASALGTAIYLMNDSAFKAFENNVVRDNQKTPIVTSPMGAGSLGAGNTFTRNGEQAIAIQDGTISKSTRWRNHGIPYAVQDDIEVEGANAPCLTLDPGNILRFAAKTHLYVDRFDNSAGALNAVGTATESITFTGVTANPNPGAWGHVYLGAGSVDGSGSNPASTHLKDCKFQYGGFGDEGTLWIQDSKPLLENITIEDSSSDGVRVTAHETGSVNSKQVFENAVMGRNIAKMLINYLP